jgi:aspartyl protease family protein
MTNPPVRNSGPGFWALLALVVAIAIVLAARNGSGETFGIADHDFVRGGYLVVVLIFVGSALFGRRLGARDFPRAATGWLAIFMVIVGGYAYRDDITAVGARIVGVLVPGMPISGHFAGIAEDAVVISRSIDGHFAVRADLNSVPTTLMLDTGASFVTLSPADAARAGINARGLSFTTPIQTANGVIQAAPTVLRTLSVGSIERHDVPALVAPTGSLDQSLLGMSFLDTLNGYAISGDRLVLTP